MKPTLAAVVVVGLSVPFSEASDDNRPVCFATVAPENDWRLAKLTDAAPQQIGILTHYANKGGGYTFMERKRIVFYALPYVPTTYYTETDYVEAVMVMNNGIVIRPRCSKGVTLRAIGWVKVPLGGQTVYRDEMTEITPGVFRREDTRLATWSRDTADGPFRLSIMAEDRETRLKLKSIVPVLEHAEHGR